MNRITKSVEEVKLAFSSLGLQYTKTEITLYRHCNNGAPQLSNWLTDEILSPTVARAKLALPNFNTAQRVIKIKVPAGIPFLEGKVASKVSDLSGLFGTYATGEGRQFYFLDEHKEFIKVISDFPNPK